MKGDRTSRNPAPLTMLVAALVAVAIAAGVLWLVLDLIDAMQDYHNVKG